MRRETSRLGGQPPATTYDDLKERYRAAGAPYGNTPAGLHKWRLEQVRPAGLRRDVPPDAAREVRAR